MTPNASELELLRSYPQASRLYLGVERGIDILTAQIDSDHAIGDTTLLLKNVIIDDLTDLRSGLTVAIHGVLANDRRVDAVFISYDSGTQVMTIGANAVTATDNQYVTVFSARKLWKLPEPAWDGSQHTLPFAIAGGDRAGFVGEPIAFIGKDSYHPLGRAIVEYHWKKFDATLVSGDLDAAGTVDNPLVLQWAAPGEYLVRLKVIDEDGEINTSFRTVLIFNRPLTGNTDTPYERMVFNSIPKWSGSGWSCNLTVYGVADNTEFPPQAKVILWKEDYYGGVQTNLGGPYRGQGECFFVGYIKGASIVSDADAQTVTFQLDTVEILMRNLEMDDFTFRNKDVPTTWTWFNSFTVAMALCYLVQYRTTLDSICDVFVSLLNYRLDIQDVPSAGMYSQISQSLLDTCFGYIGGSRYGSITFARSRNMITAAERGLFALAEITFEPQDWLKITLTSELLAGVSQVILEGQDGVGFPIRSVYPPSGPSHNGEIQRKSGMLFLDQAQADAYSIQLWKNGNRRVVHVTLELPNYPVSEPAFQSYFAIHLPTAFNNAGLNWLTGVHGIDGKEFYTTGMSYEWYAGGYILTRLDGEKSVYADDGDPWDFVDPVPTLQHVYGYDQNETAADLAILLTDDAEDVLTDDADDSLEDDA